MARRGRTAARTCDAPAVGPLASLRDAIRFGAPYVMVSGLVPTRSSGTCSGEGCGRCTMILLCLEHERPLLTRHCRRVMTPARSNRRQPKSSPRRSSSRTLRAARRSVGAHEVDDNRIMWERHSNAAQQHLVATQNVLRSRPRTRFSRTVVDVQHTHSTRVNTHLSAFAGASRRREREPWCLCANWFARKIVLVYGGWSERR